VIRDSWCSRETWQLRALPATSVVAAAVVVVVAAVVAMTS
jgi:hypothetical protein